MKRKFSQILCGLVLTGSSIFAQIPTDGLVGYWPFNGNANDESGNGNNGTEIIGGVSFINGKFGQAAKFDGYSNPGHIKVNNSSSLQFSTEATFVVWVRLDAREGLDGWGNYSANGVHAIIAKDHDANQSFTECIYLSNQNELTTWAGAGGGNAGWDDKTPYPNYSIGEWVQLTYVFNSTSSSKYINGILDTVQTEIVNFSSANTQDLFFGKYSDTWYPLNGAIDEVRIYNRALNEQEIKTLYNVDSYSIKSLSSINNVGRIFEIAISTDTLRIDSSIIAYQFDYSFDNTKLEYQSATIVGTIAAGGSITVNTTEPDKLNISYMSSTAISGVGDILKLNFKAIDKGTTTPIISNFLYNTDTVYSVSNGTISITYKYGDVDVNGYVQAYDAALALQYSVGIDALPSTDPLPWEVWRINTANVDTIGSVTANDAALILQYSAKLISTFPADSKQKNATINTADVTIAQEGTDLVFRSTGSLFGLNVFVKSNFDNLGNPEILYDNMISAFNIDADNYAIGLATAYAPTEGNAFMRIPLKSEVPITLSFEMIVNTETVTKLIETTLAISGSKSKGFSIYPNPVNNQLMITTSSSFENALVTIFNLEGKQVFKEILNLSNIDVSALNQGVYTLKISNGNETLIQKFIKK
ncbi:MAG: LamG-like jellyroll fold domain-containing protein [Salinivirgaceae bacterium]